jgi:hypothetical protein
MEQGEFQKVGKSEERMYGPWKLLVCGYPVEEHTPFLSFLEAAGFKDVPVVFVTEPDLRFPLSTLLERPNRAGFEAGSEMPRALILSGFTQRDLHTLISAYRKAQFPEQLWATLTPISEKWPIAQLLKELLKEAKAMEKRREAGKEQPA